MTPAQIDLVRSTWEQVIPIADTAAELFYGRVFEMEPATRRLFGTDMADQRRKLMQTLAVAVAALDKLETLRPALEGLGRRHVEYGVQDHQYDLVGEALLWTLQHGLGDGFTGPVRDAWIEAYAALATIMRGAAASAERAA
jgi:hemoglobin-like flavoprotein